MNFGGVLVKGSIFNKIHICIFLWAALSFVHIKQAQAQIKPLADGVTDTILRACAKGNDIYVLTKKSSAKDDTMKVLHWDNEKWNYVTYFTFSKKTYYKIIYEIIFYNDELHIGGSFDTVNNKAGFNSLMKFDGKEWVPVLKPSVFNGKEHIMSLAVFEANLMIMTKNTISKWNGSKLVKADSIAKGFYRDNVDNQFFIAGANKLYASMLLQADGPPDSRIFCVWNGVFWEPLPKSIGLSGFSATTINNDLFALANNEVLKWNGAEWLPYAQGLSAHLTGVDGIYGLFSFKKRLWLIGVKNIGTGKTSTFFTWTGKEWINAFSVTSNKSRRWQLLFTKTEQAMFIYGDLKELSANKSTNYIALVTEQAKFRGKIYYDANNNCVKDSFEGAAEISFLSISPGPLSIINTDDAGNYSFYADSGTYTLRAIPKQYWYQTCPNGNISVTANLNQETVHNFALRPMPNVQDMKVTLTAKLGWRVRKGFVELYTLCYENTGTTNAAGKIALSLDSNFSFAESRPAPGKIYDSILVWEFDSLAVGEKRCIGIFAKLDSLKIDDSIKLVAYFDGGNSWKDSSLYNNIDTLKLKVVAAFDPNDKTSYPEGNITKSTTKLRYHIRFQNTGTDTAYRVTVIDTLDSNIPVTDVKVNSASHKYKLDIKNNVFKWTFDGIMLPDSNINEPLSHGFINYTAQIKPGVAIGTEIKNTAYIYFDYQKPVITNTARNKMTEPVGVREEKVTFGNALNIYPNPAANKVYLKNTSNARKQVVVFNSIGQQIQTLVLQPQNVTPWNTNHLPNGLYFIQADGEQTHKLLIQH